VPVIFRCKNIPYLRRRCDNSAIIFSIAIDVGQVYSGEQIIIPILSMLFHHNLTILVILTYTNIFYIILNSTRDHQIGYVNTFSNIMLRKIFLVGIGSKNQIIQVSRQLAVSYLCGLVVPYKARCWNLDVDFVGHNTIEKNLFDIERFSLGAAQLLTQIFRTVAAAPNKLTFDVRRRSCWLKIRGAMAT